MPSSAVPSIFNHNATINVTILSWIILKFRNRRNATWWNWAHGKRKRIKELKPEWQSEEARWWWLSLPSRSFQHALNLTYNRPSVINAEFQGNSDYRRPITDTYSTGWSINSLTPQSLFKFWHIFPYIFVQKYYLPEFHEIGQWVRLSFQDSHVILDEWEVSWMKQRSGHCPKYCKVLH